MIWPKLGYIWLRSHPGFTTHQQWACCALATSFLTYYFLKYTLHGMCMGAYSQSMLQIQGVEK